MGSCKTKQSAFATFSALNGEWNVVELEGQQMNPDATHQFISFDITKQIVSGNAGCNRMSGKMELSDTQKNGISFSRMVTTRMACMDMKPETTLLNVLNRVVRFEPVNSGSVIHEIAFYDINDNKLLVIAKR